MEFISGGFHISSNFDIPNPCSYITNIISADFPTIQAELIITSNRNMSMPNTPKLDSKSNNPNLFLLSQAHDVLFVNNEMIRYQHYKEQNKPVNYKNIIQTILKNGIGLESYLYNRVVLHGNVFLIAGNAYAIVAPSGFGKSTLTAAMIKYCRADLLSEDSVYLDVDGITTYLGSQELYLFQDSAINLLGTSNSPENDSGKYIFSNVNTKKLKLSYQIKGIIILTCDIPSDIIKCEKAERIKALPLLLNNLRYRSVLKEQNIFNSITTLSKTLSTIPAYIVSLKKEYGYLEEQTKYLYKIISSGE